MDQAAPYAWASLGYAAAGIEPRTTNIASMEFSSGLKMLIFGGGLGPDPVEHHPGLDAEAAGLPIQKAFARK